MAFQLHGERGRGGVTKCSIFQNICLLVLWLMFFLPSLCSPLIVLGTDFTLWKHMLQRVFLLPLHCDSPGKILVKNADSQTQRWKTVSVGVWICILKNAVKAWWNQGCFPADQRLNRNKRRAGKGLTRATLDKLVK